MRALRMFPLSLYIDTTSETPADAEALSSFGFQYLSETFLPLKLQEVRMIS